MPWVRIDDAFPESQDGSAIGVLGRGLLTDMLCYCNRQLTDGHVPANVMLRLLAEPDYQGDGAAVLDRLCAKGVDLVKRTDAGWLIAHFHRYQPSRREVERERAERRKVKAAAGLQGATKRWQRDGKVDGKRVAGRMANGETVVAQSVWQTDSPVPVPVEEPDQDPGLAAGASPSASGRETTDPRPSRLPTRAPEPANGKVLSTLVLAVMQREPYSDEGDLKEAIKRECARLRLAYDADIVRRAMDAGRARDTRQNGQTRGFTSVAHLAAVTR